MRVFACLIAFAVFLAACDKPSTASANSDAASIITLKAMVENLSKQGDLRDQLKEIDETATLKPNGDGYHMFRTDWGSMTAQIIEVTPFASGSRVIVKFGNLTAAGLSDVSMKVSWGKVNEKGWPIHEASKTKQITLAKTILGGSWSSQEIVLDNTQPTDVGFIRLADFAVKAIQLHK